MKDSLVLTSLLLGVLAAAAPLPAATVRGTVFDAREQPLPGVTITFMPKEGQPRAVETTAAGRYELADVPVGHHTVVARKAGFASQQQAVVVARQDQVLGVSFRLRPWAAEAWSITGTVTREDGKTPLAGARVSLQRELFPRPAQAVGEQTTAETGFFAFTGLQPGSYRLSISAQGYLPSWGDELLFREGADRQTADVTLLLPPPHTVPGTVSGTVTDAGGKSIAATEVRLWFDGEGVETRLSWGEGMQQRGWSQRAAGIDGRAQMEIRGAVKTDAAGKFEFTMLAGSYRLKVWAAGFLSQTQPITVPAGKRAEPLALKLEQGEDPLAKAQQPQAAPPQGRIRGVVLRPDGTPLANTSIYAFVAANIGADERPWSRGYGGLSQAYVVTDADGRFEKANVQPGTALVAVKTRGFAESPVARVEVPAGGEVDAQLRLPGPSLRASGRVTTADGKPFAGARVYAYRLVGRWADGYFWDAISNGWWGQPGDGGPWPFDADPAALRPGVVAGLLDHAISYAETDAEGRFTLAELDAGTHHFGATAPGCTRESRENVALEADKAAAELAFTLAAVGSIEGVIARPDGAPLALQEVKVTRIQEVNGGQRRNRDTVQTNAEGRYRVRSVPPGTYRLRFVATGYPSADRDKVEVLPGKEATGIDAKLQAGLTLRGRVLKPDGTAAAGAAVQWRLQQSSEEAARATAGADGTFELRGLKEGAGELTARLGGFGPGTKLVTLPAAGDAPLEVRLVPTVTVRGSVRDAAGKPMVGANVQWFLADGSGATDYSPRTVTSTDTGEFVLTEVPKRKVQVGANREGYRFASSILDLAAQAGEPRVDLTLTLLQYGSVRGRVLKPDGKPLVGARVHLSVDSAGSPPPATTDEKGAFVFERVASGRGWLTIEGEGGPMEQTQLDIAPVKETVAPDVLIPILVALEGKLLGLDTLPKGARFHISQILGDDAPGDPAAVAQGVWLFLRRTDQSAPVIYPTQLRMLGTTYATGGMGYRVGKRASEPARPGRGGGYAQVAEDGTFKIPNARAGKGSLRVQWSQEGKGWVLQPSVPLTVAEGQNPKVEIALAPGGTMAGRVGLPQGLKPGAQSMVSLYRQGTLEMAAGTRLQADGAFSVPGVPAGDYMALVWEPGAAAVRRPVSVRVGETTTLDLDVPAGVTLRGKVEGNRPKGLYVSAESEASFGGEPVAEDGTFTIEHLLPGTYTLRLWSPASEAIPARPDVKLGDAGAEGVVLAWKE